MSRSLFQYHPVVGRHFIPGLKARVDHEGGGYLLRTNQAGFRCPHEFVRQKHPGAFRVLLFGDSFTAGDGVSDKQRYADVLESLLPQLEVFNFGVSGTGTDQQYLTYREMAAGIEHDLVVAAVLVENVRRVESRYRPYSTPDGQTMILAKPYFSLESDGSLRLHHVPVPREPFPLHALPSEEQPFVDRGGNAEWLRRRVNRMGPWIKDAVQRATRYQPLPHYDRPDHQSWKLLKAILRNWSEEVVAPMLIFPIPIYQYVEKSASAAGVRARFQELHDPPRVTVHDPLPDLWRHPRSQRRSFRFGRDIHPTPLLHRALAESLARGIRPFLQGDAAEATCR